MSTSAILTDNPRRQKVILAITLALIALLYLTQIGTYGFIGPDEPRYARIAQEMMDRGDWVVPTLEGSPWMEKPPLLYWCMIGSYKLFGVNEFAARFPSALAALVTALALFLALRGLYGFRMALLSMVVLATSAIYIGFAGAAATDMLFTACVTIGLLLLWKGIGHHTWNGTFMLWGGCLFLALGCLAKGPLALVLPFLALYPTFAIAGGLERLLHPRIIPGVLIFVAIAVPWFVLMYLRQGFHFILVFFINHHLARFFTTIHHHTYPFYYYIPVILLGVLPWTPFFSLVGNIRQRLHNFRDDPRAGMVAFLLSWILVPLVFFSISRAKLPGYILPLFPAVAALLGLGLEDFLSGRRQMPAWVRVFIPASFALLIIALPIFTRIRFHLLWPGLLLGGLILPGVLLFIWFLRKNAREKAIASIALCMFLPISAGGPIVFPTIEPYFSHRIICRQAMQLTDASHPLVIYRNFHHTNDYYTNYTCTPNIPNIHDLEKYLTHRQSPVYVLTKRKETADLKRLPGWSFQIIEDSGRSILVQLNRRKDNVP